MLKEITKYKIGIFLIFKANFGSFYPAGEFIIKGYSTSSRLDGNRNWGSLFLHVHEDIRRKVLNEYTSEKPIENMFVEINLRLMKWLIIYTSVRELPSILKNVIIFLFLVISTQRFLIHFSNNFVQPTISWKLPPQRIYKIWKCKESVLYGPESLNPDVYETGISDFRKLTSIVLKIYSQKIKPSIAKYIDYKDFDNNDLKKWFIRELFSENLQSNDLSQFENISKIRLEEKEPFKKRYAKYNQAKLINKNLPKAIVKYV